MKMAVCLAFILIATVHCVDAQLVRGRGEGERSRWTHTVESTDVRQMGVAVAGKNSVVIRSRLDRRQAGLGLARGGVLYDFSGSVSTTVIRAGRRCYVIPTPAGFTYASVAEKLASRNGTTVTTALDDVQRNATGMRLSDEARAALTTSRPNVGSFCSFAWIYDTVDADPATFQARGAEAEGQAVLSFLTLDSKVSILTEAMDRRGRGRGSSGRRAGPPRLSPTPRREGTVSVWNRTIDTTDVRQMALSVDNDSTVTVHSFDRRLRSLGLRPGAVLYDFSDAAVAATVIRSGPICFLVPTPVAFTYASVSADVAGRNGTTVTTALDDVQRNATGMRLSDEARAALTTSRPNVGSFCSFAWIYDTVDADPAIFPEPGMQAEGQFVASVLTLDSKVSILADLPRRPRGPRRRPSGGRGSRGRGGSGGRRAGGRRQPA